MNASTNRELPSPTTPQWEAALDEARDLDKYQPDWDGEGADAVPSVMILQTRQWLRALQSRGDSAPACVYPLADGTVMVEWHYGSGAGDSANIRGGWRVEIVSREPGAKPTFTVHSILDIIESEEADDISPVPYLIADEYATIETSPGGGSTSCASDIDCSLAA